MRRSSFSKPGQRQLVDGNLLFVFNTCWKNAIVVSCHEKWCRLFLNSVPYFLWKVTVEPITCQCEFINRISYFKVLFILFFLAAFTFSHIFELIIQPELTSLTSFRQFNHLKMFYISKYTHDKFWWVKS